MAIEGELRAHLSLYGEWKLPEDVARVGEGLEVGFRQWMKAGEQCHGYGPQLWDADEWEDAVEQWPEPLCLRRTDALKQHRRRLNTLLFYCVLGLFWPAACGYRYKKGQGQAHDAALCGSHPGVEVRVALDPKVRATLRRQARHCSG